MNIQHDQQETRGTFYIEENGKVVAQMTYKLEDDHMIVDHTVVDESFRGKDVGESLVNRGVEFARTQNIKIVPVCSYAKRVLEKGEEYQDVPGTY